MEKLSRRTRHETLHKQHKKERPRRSTCEDHHRRPHPVRLHTQSLLLYFKVVLKVLKHYWVTIKLPKYRFIQQEMEFVGMDILAQGNSPAKSKEEVFHKLTYPKSFTGLWGFIGVLGFYQDFLPLYEVRIDLFGLLLKDAPSPGSMSKQEEADQMAEAWTDEHSKLFDDLRAKASSSPLPARPSKEKCSPTTTQTQSRPWTEKLQTENASLTQPSTMHLGDSDQSPSFRKESQRHLNVHYTCSWAKPAQAYGRWRKTVSTFSAKSSPGYATAPASANSSKGPNSQPTRPSDGSCSCSDSISPLYTVGTR
jgi:hypothetical protein